MLLRYQKKKKKKNEILTCGVHRERLIVKLKDSESKFGDSQPCVYMQVTFRVTLVDIGLGSFVQFACLDFESVTPSF